jgi:hypothetical protein
MAQQLPATPAPGGSDYPHLGRLLLDVTASRMVKN